MSAAAPSCDEFDPHSGQLLDLNLTLHYSASPSHHHHQDPISLDQRFVVDLKKVPSSTDQVEDGSSQNSTLSTLTRKRNLPETEETHLPPVVSPRGISDEEDGDNSRKKLRLTKEQSLLLEDSFKEHNTLNPRQKQALAKQMGLKARQVEVWFQNRRARTKLKQTEAECEYMKRNCETLTDRVRRLQKEVNELRSLKLAPQIYMHVPQATTLTLCPLCERVEIPTPPGSTSVPVNASCVGVVDCSNVGRVGSVSGNLWASQNMIHKPSF